MATTTVKVTPRASGAACAANGLTGKAAGAKCSQFTPCPACVALANGVPPPIAGTAATPPASGGIVGTAHLAQLNSNGAAALAALLPNGPPSAPVPAQQASAAPPAALATVPVPVQPATVPVAQTGVPVAVTSAAQLLALWQACTVGGGKWVQLMYTILQHCLPHGTAYTSGQLCAASFGLLPPNKVQQTLWRGMAASNTMPAGCWGSINPTLFGYNMPATAVANTAPVRVGSRAKGYGVAPGITILQSGNLAVPNGQPAAVQPPATATQAQLTALAAAYPQQLAQLLPWALANPSQLAQLLALAPALQAHLASNAATLAQLTSNGNVLAVLAQLPTALQTAANLQQLLPTANTPA